MNRKLPYIVAISITTLSFLSGRPPVKHYELHLITNGVWAAIHLEKGGEAICNAGIIDLGDKTIIVDAFLSPVASAQLKKDAERLTGKPVSFLINTHYHNDHTRGNQHFSYPVRIISSRITRNAFLKNDTASIREEKNYVPAALKESEERFIRSNEETNAENRCWLNYYRALAHSHPVLVSTPPDSVFDGQLILSGSKRTIILKEFRNGHSESDVTVLMPSDSIVFMGDLLFNQRHPFLAEGNTDSLIKHLDYFKKLPGYKIFVPGHGPMAEKKDLQIMKDYIQFIRSTASKAIHENIPDATVFAEPIPAPFNDWLLKRFFRPNYLAVKHKQLVGTSP